MAEPQNAGEVRVALTLNLKDLKGQLDVGATNLKGYRLPIGVSLIVSAESAKDLQRDFNALHTAPVKVPVEFVYPSGGPQSGPQSGPQAPSGGPGPPGVDWSSRPYRPPKPVPDGGTVRAKPEAPAPPGAPPRTAPQPRDASGRWSRVIGKPTDVQDSPTNQPISGQPPRPTTARGGTQGGRVTLSDAERQAEDQRAYLYGLQRTVPVGQPPASRPWSGVVGRFTTSPHPDYAPEMDRWVRPPSRGPQPTRSRGTVKVGGGVGPWPRQGRDPIETGETLAAISARTDAEIAARPGSGHGVRAGGFGTPQDRRATPAQQAWRQREIDNINAINAPLAGQIEPERRAAEAKARQEAPDSELFSEAYAAARTGNLGPLRALDPTQAAMLEAYGGMAGDPSRVQAATTAIRRGYANPSGEPLTEKTGRRARRRSRQFGRLLDPRKNTAGPRAVFDEGDIETGVRFGPTGPLAAVAAAGIMPVVRHTAAENILGMAEASFADTERELKAEGIRGKALREHPDWLAAKAALAEARQALGDLLPKAGRAGGGPLSDTGMEYLLSGVTKKTFDERRIRQSRRDSSLPSWGDAWASMDMRGTGPEKVKEYRRRGLIAPWESTFGEGELEPVRAGVSPPLLRQFKKADGGPLTKRLMAARIQRSMDEGDTEKSQRLQLELEAMLGGWPAAGIASPWVQMAKRGKLPPKVSERAGGGIPSGLHDLPRVAANAVDITEVGERGREALVTMRGGGQFVVPNHQLAAFKGMVGMADGGLTNRRPGKKGLQIIGSGGGTFDERRTRATMEGLATGTAASTSIASNDIQRVHVVNWPAELGGSGTGSADVLTPARTRRERTAATSAAAAAAAAVDPTRVASAGTASRRFTLPRATASQKFASRQAGEAAIMGLQQDPNIDPITELRAQISEELSLVPVRALSVAVGQQFQQLFGGRAGILKQARRAAASTNVAAKAEARLAALDTQKEDLRTRARDLRNLPSFQRKSPEEQAEIRQGIAMELRDIRATENTARGDYFKKLAVAQQDVEKIATPAQRLRAGAVGVGGVVIGTLLFTTAMKVVQGGLELLGKAIDPAVDEILGFGQTVKRVSDELSQSVRAGGTGGRAEIAGVQAAFGLGIETPALVKRSQFLAGAQDFQQVQDTIRAEVNLRSRPSLQGITTGFGNGILPGTPLDWINQTPGLTEQIIGTVGPRPVNTEVDEQAARLERNAMVWDQINANIAKVNPSPGKFVTGLVAADPRIKATSEAIRQFSGGGPMADLMEQFGTGFVGPKGEMPTVTRNMFGDIISSTVTDAFEAALRGQAVSDPGKLFGSMRPQLQAQIDTTRRMAEFQRDTMLPSEFTMQQLAHPLSRNLMQGILPPSNAGFGGFGGVGGALSPNIARQLGAARGAVGAQAALGIQPLIDLGLSRTDIAEVRDLGREIRDMQDAAENMQLAQEATLYNRQLFITRRTLGDIVGLQGRSSTSAGGQVVAATELGQLQRAQLVDSREAARIGLARNQREINLQLALSRLQAPGETPEERAVRRREAELVAREEQKMLDINRRTTTRGFRIEDIGIDRSAQDAIFALQELQRQRQLTIDIRGIAQVVEAKQTMLGFLTSSKGIITSVGSKIAEMGIDTLGQIQGQVVELTDTFIKMVDDEFTILQKRADDLFKTGSKREGPNVSESDRGPSAGGTKIKGAQGFIGMTMGPTGFLAGEANREGVIVIRNPKVGSLSGRGGAANININFGNISVRDERDIDALAEKVVKRLHREAAIVGLS